jgi:hypothetical protein
MQLLVAEGSFLVIGTSAIGTSAIGTSGVNTMDDLLTAAQHLKCRSPSVYTCTCACTATGNMYNPPAAGHQVPMIALQPVEGPSKYRQGGMWIDLLDAVHTAKFDCEVASMVRRMSSSCGLYFICCCHSIGWWSALHC